RILKEAQDKLAQNDFEGAHKKANELPTDSPFRDDPAFKNIESKWADWIFSQANKTSDLSEKRKLFSLVAAAGESVELEKRQQALDAIKTIDASQPSASVTNDAPVAQRPIVREPNNTGSQPVPPSPSTAKTADPSPVQATGDLSADNEKVKRQL